MKKSKPISIFLFGFITMSFCIMFMTAASDDAAFHVGRVQFIANEFLSKGIEALPIRIYSTQNMGYGYGSPMFYGDIFLYPFALLTALGVDCVVSTKIAFFTFHLLCVAIPYFVLRKKIGHEKAVLFASLYGFSPYLIVNILQRGALGEVMAMAFLPWVFSVFMEMLNNECSLRKAMILAISLSCVLNSHLITSVLTVVIMGIIFVIACIKRKKCSFVRSRIVGFLFAAICFFILNASFIFPMFEQFMEYRFRAFDGSGFVAYEQTLDFANVFASLLYYMDAVLSTDMPMIQSGLFCLPFVSFLLMWLLWNYKRISRKEFIKSDILVLGLSIVILVIFWDLPWKILSPILGFVQFPWRLSMFATLLMAAIFMDGNTCGNAKKTEIVKYIYFITSALYMISSLVCGILTIENNPITITTYGSMGWQDYIVAGSTPIYEKYLQNEVIGHKGKYLVHRNNNELKVEFYDYDDSTEQSFELPIIPYKGYSVIMNETDRLEYTAGGHSQLLVTIPEGTKLETIEIYYEGTSIQKTSALISAFGWCEILVLVIEKKKMHV